MEIVKKPEEDCGILHFSEPGLFCRCLCGALFEEIGLLLFARPSMKRSGPGIAAPDLI